MWTDDDDVPWADPEIRIDYEAALGRFILAFNEVDYRLTQLIGWELSTRGRATNLVAADGSMSGARSGRRPWPRPCLSQERACPGGQAQGGVPRRLRLS